MLLGKEFVFLLPFFFHVTRVLGGASRSYCDYCMCPYDDGYVLYLLCKMYLLQQDSNHAENTYIYPHNESQRDALFLKFIWQNTVHVSDMSTVHHQQHLNTVYTQLTSVMLVLLASASHHHKNALSHHTNNERTIITRTQSVSGVPRNFVRGGSTNSVEDRGQRERGSGGGSPPSQGFWRQL